MEFVDCAAELLMRIGKLGDGTKGMETVDEHTEKGITKNPSKNTKLPIHTSILPQHKDIIIEKHVDSDGFED